MQHKLLRLVIIILAVIVVIFVWKEVTVAPGPRGETPDAQEPATDVRQVADRTLTMLENQDYDGLATVVDPDAGLTFYPYTYINPDAEPVQFPADMIPMLPSLSSTRVWGIADGSGEPLNLSVGQYMQHFVIDRDYGTATDVRINDMAQAGNTPNNVVESFPGTTVVSYHMPATDEGGMNWSTLRLVFRQKEGTWYLQAIVHDAWTI